MLTSVFSLEIQLSKWKATTPLNTQRPPLVVHVQARYCLQRLMSYPLFVLNHLRWEVAVLFINVNRILDHLFKYYFHNKVIVTLYVYNQYSEITNTVIHVQIECIFFNDEHPWPPGRFTYNYSISPCHIFCLRI